MKAETIDLTQAVPTPPPTVDATQDISAPRAAIEAAFRALDTDPGALFEEPVLEALRTVDPADYARYRTRAKESGKVSVTDLDDLTQPESGPAESTSARLIALAKKHCRLCHNADKQGVAIVEGVHHREVWMVRENGFSQWLSATYYREFKEGVSMAALKAASVTIEAVGLHEGDEVAVHVRCAKDGDAYYLDLCDERWRAVKIDKSGYEVQDRPAVLFTRNTNMRPLPMPIPGATLDLLWNYTNVLAEQRPLVIAWALDCMRPDTGFPVLEIVGAQGSAKSTTQRILRDLIDPNKVALRGAPKSTEDMYVAAAGSWIVSYENLSILNANQQDTLCTLSTGGGYATRKFNTNGEEHVIEAKRPVMLNGINGVVTRPDLIERTVRIDAPSIPADKRQEDADLKDGWNADYPKVFGALLDRFAKVLAVLPNVNLKERQRMADFQRLGEAVLRVEGSAPGAFSKLYGRAVQAGTERALEDFGIAQALTSFMSARKTGKWTGTVGTLLRDLDKSADSDRSNWPTTPRALTDQLNRLAPALREQGLVIAYGGRTNSGRTVTITKA